MNLKILLQFFLLLWKNFLLQFRRPIGTIFELINPIFGLAVLVILRYTIATPEFKCFRTFDATSLQFEPLASSSSQPPFSSVFTPQNCNFTYFYTPKTPATDAIVNRAKQILSIPNVTLNFTPTSSELEIERLSVDIINGINSSDPLTNPYVCQTALSYASVHLPIIAGLIFDKLDTEIEVTIRLNQETSVNWRTSQVEPSIRTAAPRVSTSPYISEGFLVIQDALSQSIIDYKITNKSQSSLNYEQVPIDIRQFPYPKYKEDFFLIALGFLLPILIVFSFIYTAGTITKEIVIEKETRLRESMKMMGLLNWVNWLSWFTKQIIFMSLVVVCLALELHFGLIFSLSNFLIIFIWLMLYVCYMISLSFLVSTFFTSSRLGLLVSFLVWFLSFFPYLFLFVNYDSLPLYGKFLSCLLGNTCMSISIRIFISREIENVGVQWDNIAEPTTATDHFNMLHVFGMMTLVCVVQFLLTWYLDEVLPKTFGLRKPFYFPFTSSYWCGSSVKCCSRSRVNSSNSVMTNDVFEVEPDDIEVGIQIEGITKKYTRKKIALDNLRLNMYRGQITALLGHNGAGKSTLISILTGLIPPTNGNAYIYGMNIHNEMDSIRNHLGICPQSNILFDRMTVKEHLHFFIRLKGIWGWTKAKIQVQGMLSNTKLEDKVNTLSSQLSGGMKRRLSVGLALIGDTKVIILDEPTSGVDPYARRTTWDLLLKYKQDRTILLTTHHMDEADILGDRIAILSEGVLKTCGSSLFLKNKFGLGYHLTIVKSPTFDGPRIKQILGNFLPNAYLKDDIGSEISYIIPSHDTSKFAQLFQVFENSSTELGIESYGISHTSMEDVFRTVSDDDSNGDTQFSGVDKNNIILTPLKPRIPKASLDHSQQPIITNVHSDSIQFDDSSPKGLTPNVSKQVKLNSGVLLWFQQLWAMIIKKAWYSFRSYGFIILQIILPVVFTLVGLALEKVPMNNDGPNQNLRLTIQDTFPNPSRVSLFYMQVPGIGDSLPQNFTLNHVSNFSQLSFSFENEILTGFQDILNSTINYTQPSQCCNYEYQILDQYCAHRIARDFKSVSLCNTYPNFGYTSCLECADCFEAVDSSSCPRPPPIIYDPAQPQPYSGLYYGPLAVNTVYINEYLLREMARNVNNFYANYLLGITTNKLDPLPIQHECLCCSELNTNDSNDTGFCSVEQSSPIECVNPGIGDLYPSSTPRPDRVTLWFNNQAYHTLPTALSILHNYMFYNAWKEHDITGDPPKIVINNHPLPRSSSAELAAASSPFPGFTLSIFLTFGLSFLTGSFIIFPLQEKGNRSKFLQFISGLNSWAYWVGIFLWDLVITLFSCTLVFATFPCFSISAFSGVNLVYIYLLLISYGFGSLTLVYFFSFLFNSALFAFSTTILLLFFSYQIFNLIVVSLLAFDLYSIGDIFNYIFSIFPNYSLGTGISQIVNNTIYLELCQEAPRTLDSCRQVGIVVSDNLFTFEKPGILLYIVVPLVAGIIFFILTLLIESLKVDKKLLDVCCHKEGKYSEILNEDTDVAQERSRIKRNESNGNAVLMRNLTKTYPGNVFRRRKPKLAVNQICMGISYGDCFGLLGVNGAGKTTTFEMLAGNLRCTSGTAFVEGFDIRKNLRKVRQNVGYCPQFDALQTYMTGKQLLSMYARIRGIPSRKINEFVQLELERMGLMKYARVQCGKYSGGNKRKLSAACSLIGNAPILLLDEPTTGMDPGSRRFFWDILHNLTKEGRCIVLSSHSMEECEALCTRIAIMVNGEFKCLGSTQHLKTKFGEGYTLSIRFRSCVDQSDRLVVVNNIKAFVTSTFKAVKLAEEHNVVLEYRLVSSELLCSYIFKSLEMNKDRLGILDYGVSQTTLDQIFVNFAKAQVSEDS
ncbi:ATP-binding cassette sub-family A member 3-like [Oopsacas minuta]|uniref:ATP-binding cassette sub-family A member 3-like n=1 Tax=Oopsacas minuta TaxID=111878 RepID=A0AAV7JZA7_9METZ|nr:ATP-binding cassette sub-family A member 3-like [Oopsacas minuta]